MSLSLPSDRAASPPAAEISAAMIDAILRLGVQHERDDGLLAFDIPLGAPFAGPGPDPGLEEAVGLTVVWDPVEEQLVEVLDDRALWSRAAVQPPASYAAARLKRSLPTEDAGDPYLAAA